MKKRTIGQYRYYRNFSYCRYFGLLLVLFTAVALVLGGCGKTPEETLPQETETERPAETTAPAQAESTAAQQTSAASAAETAAAPEPEPAYKAPDYVFTAENFPRMDGSTASQPLGKKITAFLLGIGEDEADAMCRFNRTTQSFRNLIAGNCDLLVVGEPNAAVFDEMEEEGFASEMEEIATDALVFIVNESNPVDSLTTDQIRDIYSGKITSWKEVGGEDVPIVAFQRNEGAGSQALIRKLIMKETEMAEAPASEIVDSMGGLMTAVKSYDNSANALGYSVYYYANDMKMARGLKILKVDGIAPEEETIRNRSYPHLNAYYCVIPAKPEASEQYDKAKSDSARVIYDWLMTKDGQALVASLGYVSVMEPENAEVDRQQLTEQYTTLDGKKIGQIGELEAGKSYDGLIPFIGDRAYTGDGFGYEYEAGSLYGFTDRQGRIVSDAVYTEVEQIGYYEPEVISGANTGLPVYRISNTVRHEKYEDIDEENVTSRYRLAAMDGSFVSEKDYGYVCGYENGILCMDDWDADQFEYFSPEGKLMFTEKEVLDAVSEGLSKAALAAVEWGGLEFFGDFYVLRSGEEEYILDPVSFRVVSGPWFSVNYPKYGRTCVYTERTGSAVYELTASVLDENLQPLPAEEWNSVTLLGDGNFVGVNRQQQWCRLYDRNGKLKKEFPGATSASETVYGFTLSYLSGNQYIEGFYDPDGELLYMVPYDHISLNDSGEPVLAVYGTKEEGKAFRSGGYGEMKGTLLYQLETGGERYEDGAVYVNRLYTEDGSQEPEYLVISRYNDATGDFENEQLIDRNLQTVAETEGRFESLYDPLEKKEYIAAIRYNEGTSDLLDGSGKLLVKDLKGDVRICGGWIFTTDRQKTEGRKIGEDVSFRYLLASAGED